MPPGLATYRLDLPLNTWCRPLAARRLASATGHLALAPATGDPRSTAQGPRPKHLDPRPRHKGLGCFRFSCEKNPWVPYGQSDEFRKNSSAFRSRSRSPLQFLGLRAFQPEPTHSHGKFYFLGNATRNAFHGVAGSAFCLVHVACQWRRALRNRAPRSGYGLRVKRAVMCCVDL